MPPLHIDILGAGSIGLAFAGRLSVHLPAGTVRFRLLTRTAEQARRSAKSGTLYRDDANPQGIPLAFAAVGPAAPAPTGHQPSAPAPIAAAPVPPGIAVGSVPAAAADPAAPPDPSEPAADVVLLCVKAPDTGAAVQAHAARLRRAGLVAGLQNGLGAEGPATGLCPGRVVRGTTRAGAHRPPEGGVRLVSPGRTLFEPAPASAGIRGREALERLIAVMNAAGLPAGVADPIEPHLWNKLLINAAVNAPATLLMLKNGELAGRPKAVAWMRGVVAEVLDVARAAGIGGMPADVEAGMAEVMAVAKATAGNTCSMLADRRAGRVTEVDWLNGAVVALGCRLDVRTPVNLELWQRVTELAR